MYNNPAPTFAINKFSIYLERSFNINLENCLFIFICSYLIIKMIICHVNCYCFICAFFIKQMTYHKKIYNKTDRHFFSQSCSCNHYQPHVLKYQLSYYQHRFNYMKNDYRKTALNVRTKITTVSCNTLNC